MNEPIKPPGEPIWNPTTQLWEGEDMKSPTPQSTLKMHSVSGRAFCKRGCGRPVVFATHPQTGKRITADPITHERHVCKPEDIQQKLEDDLKMQPIRQRVASAQYVDVLKTWNELYHKQRNGGPPLTEREEMFFKACDERVRQIEGDSDWVAAL